MNILIVCSCLEPGRCGIGDYSRRLATQLSYSGHNVILFSFGDSYVDCFLDQSLSTDDYSIRICRFRSRLLDKKSFYIAQQILDNFKPALVSIQYNPYSFSPKGIPFRFLYAFSKLASTIPVHIVFHEIWVSYRLPVSWRKKIYTPFQKLAILYLMRCLNVVSSFTTNLFYQSLLSGVNISADLIPVFSCCKVSASYSLSNCADKSVHDILLNWSGPKLLVFGNLNGTLCLRHLSLFIKEKNLESNPCLFLVVGKLSSHSKSVAKEVFSKFMSSSRLCYSGPVDELSLSVIIQNVDYAITTYPYELAGKSSAVATLRAHDLPVYFVGVNLDGNQRLMSLSDDGDDVTSRLGLAVSHVETALASNC